MIPDIKELNFPKKDGKQYATLTQADVSLADMGERTITATVKIDGDIEPDFSFDWEIEYEGEKYIMPTRKPQGSKGNESRKADYELTFQHWAVYQLKRWFFHTIQAEDASTGIPDKYVADVQLNLGGFCEYVADVLKYYYGDTITIELNPNWVYDKKVSAISISYTSIWNVITNLYEVFAVRWEIVPTGDTSHYKIKVGYPSTEISHVLKYGWEGGLLKIERQIQSSDVYNLVLGRGGSDNLPRYYFKRVPDSERESGQWTDDPDWIVELDDVPFDRLHGATFRSYIQGWKAAHIEQEDEDGNLLYSGYTAVGEANAYAPWAYRKGFTDTKFDPVEYVADKILADEDESGKHVTLTPSYAPPIEDGSSIDKYGAILNGLSDNDEFYPTLQGTGMDIAVEVEKITSDEGSDEPIDVTISDIGTISVAVTFEAYERQEIKTEKRTGLWIPEGRTANLIVGSVTSNNTNVIIEGYAVNVYNAKGENIGASGLQGGAYYSYEIVVNAYNASDTKQQFVLIRANDCRLQDAALADYSGGTFDIWVKNIWYSTKSTDESNLAYAERVWKPVLGDREGNEAAVVFTSGALAVSDDYEFKIVKVPAYDTSKSYTDDEGEVHTSHWRITCVKSDADLESLGKYVPNTQRNGKAGDTFVFIGTELTHIPYVVDAEIRLDDWKQDECNKSGEVSPTYVATPERIRFNNGGAADALIKQIKIGCSVKLEDKRFIGGIDTETLYVQSKTIKYREPSESDAALNADIEITLGSEYATTSNPVSTLQGEVSAIQRQIGSISNIAEVVTKTGDKRYLRKDASDRTPYSLGVGKGIEVGDYVSGVSGAKIDGSGNGELLNLLVRAMISSAKFADGFTGEGWRIWLEEGLSRLTVDKLTVRKAMTVFELLIEKIRAIGGQLYVSAASGKIKSVREEEDGLRYGIAFEQGNEFTSSDLIRCQTFSGGTLKNYWVTVDEVIDDEIFIEKTEFEGQSLPEVGDECVLAGNSYITDRQNLILISATEDGQPRIDILDGVSGKSFEGCLRARLGALSGITDSAFASDKQPSGYGIYSDNVFLRGEFVLSSGEDVATRFEVTEGKITSAVDSLRGDVDVPGNFISNPMFADGMNGWEMFSDTPITVDDTQTTANIIVPTASVVRDSDGRPVCRITQCGISQSRNDMVGEPDEYPTGDDGLKKPVPVYLSFLYKANTSSGRISARLTNSRRTGFVTRYTPLSFEEQTVVGDEYRLVTCSGLWNGAGGLIIEMTGGTADVYMVTLTQDKAGALATKYSTLFEQSDKLVKISASNFDADGNVLEESSIAATAREISLSVKEEIDGELKNTGIDITSGEIELRSDMVRFTDSEGKEQAFITNGKIHANAIDADNITASRLEMYRKDADGNKAARPTVVITPEQKGMAIYKDDTGVTCQEFTGKEYTDEGAAAFFGENSSGTLSVTSAGSKPTLTATEALPSRDRSSKYNISTAIQIAASTTVEITVGKLQAYASAISGSVPADDPSVIVPTVFSSANSTVSLYLRIYAESGCSTLVEEHVVASVSASSVARRDISTTTTSEYTYTATPDNQILDCAGKGVRIQSGGYARLEVVYSESVSGYTTSGASTAYIAYGTQVTGGAQIAANYKTDSYISRFFANGFCLGTRTDNYALAQNTASGIGFGVQSGDGAGFKLSKSSGFRQLVNANGNDPWCPIPKLLCRCTYNYVSSSTSYSPAYDGYNFATDYPAPSRTATGKVRITIPSTWTEILGSNVLVAKRLLVSVEGRNTSNVFGAVTGISNGYIYISLQTPSAAADGSFILTIELI